MSQRLCPPCTKAILKIDAVSRDEPGSTVYELTEERKATPISKAAAKCALCNLVHTYLTQYADSALPDDDERSSYYEKWETKPTAKIEYIMFGRTLDTTAGEELYPDDSLFLSMTRDLRSFTFNVWVEEEFANSTNYHPECTQSISGEVLVEGETLLPARVLEVNVEGNSDIVRLRETDNEKARYCTLSHCWGTEDRRPYTVTTGNLEKALSGLRLTELPRTFREAIAMTRALGVDYLWIDSLCIIQDSESDWLAQSQQMGRIYQGAFVVLAAADSENATEGLLVTERHPELTVRIPGSALGQKNSGTTINLNLMTLHESDPDQSRLRSRAWAFQEWLLARRLLLFMRGGITWKCKKRGHSDAPLDQILPWRYTLLPETEQGAGKAELERWFSLISYYSSTNLTVKTDRLIALQGVVNEINLRRQQKYFAGVWEKDLAVQLAWHCVSDNSKEDLPHLPSWSWAAMGGRKDYAFTAGFRYYPGMSTEAESSVAFDSLGKILIASGDLRRVLCRQVYLSNNPTSTLPTKASAVRRRFFFTAMRRSRMRGYRIAIYELALDAESEGIGAVIFDSQPVLDVYMLPLVSFEGDRWR
ncbi:uncharacterized protein E0L32_003809 [Thyridium curvatum]|uniref:Heterokaryon incompatibility domain-containing protein n=1 Tax=Thyridium curvatum TaxID=1093900 RepID=A0A507B095_9PEZI|nr:uncharacterized protein E0L32_003809 [Thyridium curvatum]TPX16515.1 hypothetical protein E0L32_003809 [Thyridium curvatum]